MPKLDLTHLTLQGRHLIEASAGTGKTFSLTRIYLRLLIEEKIPVEQILLMTYTRAATQELRGRIADIIREAQRYWDNDTNTDTDTDEYWQHLYNNIEPEQAKLLLHQALLNLDQAAIFTIHGFCGRALQQYAFTSQTGLEVVLETNTRDLAYTSLQDWLRVVMHDPERYQQLEQQGWHTPEGFWDAFSNALLSPMPVFAAAEQVWHEAWYTTKLAVRESLLSLEIDMIQATMSDAKTKDVRLVQWQDLLNWLGTKEFGPASKDHLACLSGRRLSKAPDLKDVIPALAKRINTASFKDNYLIYAQQAATAPLVLEAVQGVREAYKKAKHKQQIMEFDDLVRHLSECVNDSQNEALVDALRKAYPVALVDEFQDTDGHQYAILNRLYGPPSNGTTLFMIGDPKQAIYGFRGGDIHTYLKAAQATDDIWYMDTNWRSSHAMVSAYNRLFSVQSSIRQVFGNGIVYVPVKASNGAKANLANNPKTEGAALTYVWLPTALTTNDHKQQHIARWCVAEIQTILQQGHFKAADIALLVRGAGEAQALQTALKQAHIASVFISDRSSVYASTEAIEMVRLLNGVLHCEDPRQLMRAASTHLWGGSVAVLARLNQDDSYLISIRSQMLQLRQLWLRQGVMALITQLLKQRAVPPTQNKERYMTNMVQLAELLQKASNQASSALLLVEWLQQQCQAEHADTSAELRLESDAKLIQIVTQHGSKGLEYPVVFIPFVSQAKDPLKWGTKKIQLFPYYHEQEQCPALMIGRDPEVSDAAIIAAEEEALRLLYVAVTRAQYKCYLPVSNFKDAEKSPLGQLLFGKNTPDDALGWPEALEQLTDPKDSELRKIEEGDVHMPSIQCPTSHLDSNLVTQSFTGQIDTNTHLLSYSAIVRQLSYGAYVQQPSAKDQSDGISQMVVASQSIGSNELRFTLAKGKNSGLLLHDILEQVDFANPSWPSAMEVPLAKYHTVVGIQQHDADKVVALQAWLEECLKAPLPTINDPDSAALDVTLGLTLGQLLPHQTLREVEFYFPLQQAKQSTLGQILSRHRGGLPSALPSHPVLQGMMHGFIDLVFEDNGRFFVADYKSNHLGDMLEDYHLDAMLEANQQHYYDLQYLIYSLALHRYLKQRMPHYDAHQHFGGVYYLYLRGMSPKSSTGVFSKAISLEELTELDDLFAGVSI